jgi:hypothetical protein
MVVILIVAICSKAILLIIIRIAWDSRNGSDNLEVLRIALRILDIGGVVLIVADNSG